MGKMLTWLGALIAVAVVASDRPALARLTAEDQVAVPSDILNAYEDIRHIYVCPRTDLEDTDRQLGALRERIRLRYRPDFDVRQHDEMISLPTICPSPKSIPDFEKRVAAYRAAVQRLDDALARHPSPVNEELAQEDAATRFLILEVLNRVAAKKGAPVCINGILRGTGVSDLAELKKETIDSEKGPLSNKEIDQLESMLGSEKTRNMSTRTFDATLQTWGKWRVRPATFDECSRYLTYRIRRPIISGDLAIISGVNVESGASVEFGTIATKSNFEWALVYNRAYGGYSEGRPARVLPGGSPGEEGDPFYILE